MLKVKDLRDSFIDYFKSKDHRHIHSSTLIPKDDPTLLFTTAGMVQFKPMFAGTVDLEYTRAASIQKCLRTSDLENVGRTERHCTFFEMLGNFSFGDYFKEEAIEFAWDYSTNILKFDKEKIWVSIYQDDDESFEIWNKVVGVPESRIVRLGKEDNFWGPAGDSGACGPCSELYVDKGEEHGCGSPDCKPGCDCERFMEYWNLVFNQFFQNIEGVQTPLPKTGIDTGMGLERLATICQNVKSIFDTDELKSLCQFVCNELKVDYKGDKKIAVNVIVEHARSLTFAMADGAYPSNEGRGYVLRRILRRALRFGRVLGIKDPFIFKLVDEVVKIYGSYYPEIKDAQKNIKNVLEGEEKRFLETLEKGMEKLDEIINRHKLSGEKVINGKEAFILYDTYGFPAEMTEEIAEENQLQVDMDDFHDQMLKQKERGKQSWKGNESDLENALTELSKISGTTEFMGYDKDSTESDIVAISNGKELVDSLNEGDEGYISAKSTVFYGESGGQAGDEGKIINNNDVVFKVLDTKKNNNTIIHYGILEKGIIKKGDRLTFKYNKIQRNLTRANHTVTHMLQAALRIVLGDHVKQAGSLVSNERLRFDFSHYEAMSKDQVRKVEEIVNEKIWENLPVSTDIMDINDALKSGAMAEFGEKYNDKVRVVSVGDFSRELCGGTHVDNSGKIGLFKILKESSPGAGVRRIEAITLKGIEEKYTKQDDILNRIFSELNAGENDILQKVKDLVKKNSELQKDIDRLKNKNLASGIDDILNKAVEYKGIKIITHNFDGAGVNEMRNMADLARTKEPNSVVIFGTKVEDKAMLLIAATKTAVASGIDCGSIIKEASPVVGGGGGGRKDMAQAGGKNPSMLKEALEKGSEVAQNMIQ